MPGMNQGLGPTHTHTQSIQVDSGVLGEPHQAYRFDLGGANFDLGDLTGQKPMDDAYIYI